MMGLFGLGKKDSRDSARADAPTAAATPAGLQAMLSDGSVVAIRQQVDCLGDSCPRPQIMARRAVQAAAPGEVVEILVDNPTSVENVPPICNSMNATHLETLKDAKCWRIYLRKD